MQDPITPHNDPGDDKHNAAPPANPMSQRETVDLDAPTEPRASRWAWVIDRNPLFLLSGVFMLGGCFLVSGAIHDYDPAEVGEGVVLMLLIALLVVLNVYEFAVIWLRIVLSRSQKLVRDTRHLLGLALLLLVDAAFVYNETSIFKPEIGVAIAAVASVLALIKAWWITRSLGIRPTRAAAAVASISLAVMYILPVLVRLMAHDGFLSQPMAMLVWCLLGAIVAAYAAPTRWVSFRDSIHPDHAQLQRLVAGGLILLPLVSLIGHASALLWVYENAFELSMLSPILLGLAAVILRQQDRLGGPAASAKAATILVACAVVPCLLPARELTYESLSYTWLAFSPLRGVLIFAPIVLAWGWWIAGRGALGAVLTVLPIPFAALGHTLSAMIGHAVWLFETVVRWLPRTQLQWGALAITAAFVCLAAGGLISWCRMSKGRTPKVQQEPKASSSLP
ncbi:MAG: hypothetical protein AAGB26_18110 [Planctomycetota bacterium]